MHRNRHRACSGTTVAVVSQSFAVLACLSYPVHGAKP